MDHQNLVYTNERTNKARASIVASLFAVVMLVIGYIAALLHGDWWMMGIFIFVGMLLSFFMYVFFQTEPKNIYRYEVKADGLFQQWIYAGELTELFIPFADMDLVLIGMVEDKTFLPGGRKMYQYHALLVIQSEDDYFFKKFTRKTEFDQWMNRFQGKVPAIQYTTMNLEKAFSARKYMKIDFAQAPMHDRDIVSDYIGAETYTSLLENWEPRGMCEGVLESHRKKSVPRTRKAERWTMRGLFVYNLLFALFVFPIIPVDQNGLVELSETVLIGYVIVNVIVPTAFVFWRSFTRWYLPLLFAVVTLAGNMIGVLGALWIQDFPFMFASLFILHAFTIVLWTVALIHIKLLKLIRIFLRDWEFGRG